MRHTCMYWSVAIVFLQTIWKSQFAAIWCKLSLERRTREFYICCNLFIFTSKHIAVHANSSESVNIRILETSAYQLRIYKSAFYSYNFHIFRLFGFGKEEGDVYRFMVTICFCHDHQRCVMYVLSYVSVDFLQTIIWKSLFSAVCARWV